MTIHTEDKKIEEVTSQGKHEYGNWPTVTFAFIWCLIVRMVRVLSIVFLFSLALIISPRSIHQVVHTQTKLLDNFPPRGMFRRDLKVKIGLQHGIKESMKVWVNYAKYLFRTVSVHGYTHFSPNWWLLWSMTWHWTQNNL